jgi:hypothetical protein
MVFAGKTGALAISGRCYNERYLGKHCILMLVKCSLPIQICVDIFHRLINALSTTMINHCSIRISEDVLYHGGSKSNSYQLLE